MDCYETCPSMKFTIKVTPKTKSLSARTIDDLNREVTLY